MGFFFSFFVKHAIITDVNAMGFIFFHVHPWLVLNLYLTFNLVLVYS